MSSFDSIQFKLERAGEHINRLDQLVRTYLRNNPQLISAEFDAQNLVNIYRYKPPDEVSIEVKLVAGDAINNLRSSLEYLAWQLVITNGKTPTDGTGFPIFSKPNSSKFGRMTAGMPAKACQLIERLQPYNGTERAQDLLSRLHTLWLIEKHRHLVLTAVVMSTSMSIKFSDVPRVDQSAISLSELDNGDIILRVPVPDATHEYLEPELLCNIVFHSEGEDERGESGILETLWPIYYLLRNRVFPRFMHFFK